MFITKQELSLGHWAITGHTRSQEEGSKPTPIQEELSHHSPGKAEVLSSLWGACDKHVAQWLRGKSFKICYNWLCRCCDSPEAAHPGRFCRLCPGHTDEKQLEKNRRRRGQRPHKLPLWNPQTVGDAGGSRRAASLTQQLVGPAVEGFAGSGVPVLLVVLDWSEVSQSPHEAPEVDLVFSDDREQVRQSAPEEGILIKAQTDKRKQTQFPEVLQPLTWFPAFQLHN